MEYTNEAFWFFYWVSFFSGLTPVLIWLGVMTAIISGIAGGIHGEATTEMQGWKVFAWGIVASTVLFVSALFTPPKEAFYAGAAQEIVQTEEVTESLINLKNVIDKKLVELGVEKKD
jgi:hypothetical protein